MTRIERENSIGLILADPAIIKFQFINPPRDAAIPVNSPRINAIPTRSSPATASLANTGVAHRSAPIPDSFFPQPEVNQVSPMYKRIINQIQA